MKRLKSRRPAAHLLTCILLLAVSLTMVLAGCSGATGNGDQGTAGSGDPAAEEPGSGAGNGPEAGPEAGPVATLEIRYPADSGLESFTVDVPWTEGLTVQTVLVDYGKANGVPVVLAKGSLYVQGIGGLLEGDMGDTFGWVYTVDGESPMVSAAEFPVEEGAHILWDYIDYSVLFEEAS